MTFESAIAFFLAVFLFGATPGPGVFAVMARAMAQGATSCVPLAFGMVASDLIYLTLACFGLASIAENWSGFFTLVRIAGAMYLLYLGIQLWRNAKAEYQQTRVVSGYTASLLQGFMISASNPKVILFYLAFLPTFISLSSLNSTDLVLVNLLAFLALMISLMVLAVLSAYLRRKAQSDKAMIFINRLAGSLMIGAAGYLLSRP